jgi:hypothetical protein
MLHPTPEERLLYSSSHGGGKEGKEKTIILNEKVFLTTGSIGLVLFVCSPGWPQTHVPLEPTKCWNYRYAQLLMDIKSSIKEYYEQLYAHKFDNLDKWTNSPRKAIEDILKGPMSKKLNQ